ncbi:nucleoside-diphosphate sugar epimerase/dehydratase [Micrococcus terreus]|uniref:polysaccharide biosynthesis protein n=1 Tax=Micrococcus terreus TaxID=574650 RepID=UPI002953A599|nr:nucleoside-diphosphate sugar epimerase/dehydratase [Micrococcus terreus]WOO96334.1 nucleoside-diphosphate sugar epimerase/dehydratase [Micrococcus terreus]
MADPTETTGCKGIINMPSGQLSTAARAVIGDVSSWIISILIAGSLRSESFLEGVPFGWLLLIGLGAAALQALIGYATRLYRGKFLYGAFHEMKTLIMVTLCTGVVVSVFTVLLGELLGVARSAGILGTPLALVFQFGLRYLSRLRSESRITAPTDAQRALIYGAGYLGSSIVRRLQTDARATITPVGLIDDDPAKRGLTIHGVPVLGGFDELESLVADADADSIVICISKADSPMVRRISDRAGVLGLDTMVLPPLDAILRGHGQVRDIKAVSIEDLIGRRPVNLDLDSIAATLTGKRVLVTGAGGSIGSELCRQVTRFSPAELIMLDRDETGLQETQLSILGHGLLNSRDVVLADIRDPEALKKIFTERQPEVVFHAAALKHLPMLEQFPDEGWKTNVLGTRNVLQAALDADVKTFVNISTDKAADPTSFLGRSKRLAEHLTAGAAARGGLKYMSVRFGNVIGSRGSMLPTFQKMIDCGGPITVTDPDVTRYFMTIPEACQLVIQAGGIGRPGEVMILDMGEPVKILDIAQRMIAMSGKDIDIIFTGLREGEKLHEDLIGAKEKGESPFHPKIFHASVSPIDLDQIDEAKWAESTAEHLPPSRAASHTPFDSAASNEQVSAQDSAQEASL